MPKVSAVRLQVTDQAVNINSADPDPDAQLSRLQDQACS
jgi:hypothetical protein